MNQVLSKPVEEEPLLAALVLSGFTTHEAVATFKKQKEILKAMI